MEDFPTYGVTLIAEAPATSLTAEQFRTQALARVWAAGTHYLADTTVAHRPAHNRQGIDVPALHTYNVQVWDLSHSTQAKPLGKFVLVADADTADECLSILSERLTKISLCATGVPAADLEAAYLAAKELSHTSYQAAWETMAVAFEKEAA